MATRRILLALIGLLSAFIVVAGAGVAALAALALRGQPMGPTLVIISGDGQLIVRDAAGAERVIADDSSPDLFRYPVPSPDGSRVAYISQGVEGFGLHSLDLRSGRRTELFRSPQEPPLYMVWSPDGAQISFITNQLSGGLSVYLVPSDGSAAAELISTSPSSAYFAWRPDSDRLLLHNGGPPGDLGRLTTYQPGQAEPLSELSDPGFFKAPAWSVDGDSFFYVAQPGAGAFPTPETIESRLTRVDSSGAQQVIVSEPQVALLFSRAPTSDHIAYVTVNAQGFGALKVVGPGATEATIVSRPDEQIPAFFWSPDGSQIAYLTFAPSDGPLPRLTWHVVGREGGAVRDLGSFVPSQAFAALVNFFDAYTHSVNIWAPGGGSLVYGTAEGVYTLDVATGESSRSADGVLAVWSGQAR